MLLTQKEMEQRVIDLRKELETTTSLKEQFYLATQIQRLYNEIETLKGMTGGKL